MTFRSKEIPLSSTQTGIRDEVHNEAHSIRMRLNQLIAEAYQKWDDLGFLGRIFSFRIASRLSTHINHMESLSDSLERYEKDADEKIFLLTLGNNPLRRKELGEIVMKHIHSLTADINDTARELAIL